MKFIDRYKAKQERKEANRQAWAEKQENARLERAQAREMRELSLQASAEGLVRPGEGQVSRASKVKIKELKKELMTGDNARKVLQKVLEVAMNDDHQGQVACLKMCMDRMLPLSAFEEKDGSGFNGGVTIILGRVKDPREVPGEVIDG